MGHHAAPRDGMLSALETVMPTREVSRAPRPFSSDRARALAESVLAFAIILAPLAMVTTWPPWVYRAALVRHMLALAQQARALEATPVERIRVGLQSVRPGAPPC